MKTRNIVGIGLFILVVLVALGVSVLAVRAYRSPLGAALQVPQASTASTAPAIPLALNQADPTAAAPVMPAVDPSAVCGETTAWNILVLGSDAGDLRGEKGSDLTRVMRVDFPNRKVTVYAFSRDLWVDTRGLGLTFPTVDAAQLGRVFYEARIRSTQTGRDAMLDATRVSARMLLQNFSVGSDHYVTLDLTQIPGMVDAVGGIPVNIPQAITDPWIGMTIPAGQQVLNGAQFVGYARAIPDSDFGRMQRNNLLVNALREKLLDPAVWASLPQLYTQFNNTIATDLSPEQINHLSCLLKEVPAEAIVQDQVRPEWTAAGPEKGSLVWDRTAILNRLRELGLVQ